MRFVILLLALLAVPAAAQIGPQFKLAPGTAGTCRSLTFRDPATGAQVPIGCTDGAGFQQGDTLIQGTIANKPALYARTFAGTRPGGQIGKVGHQIEALEDFGSFSDRDTHFGFLVVGGKSTSTAQTTGSWTLFDTFYNGYGGGSDASFITAGMALMRPVPSSFNNRGNFTAWNPVCLIDTGMDPTSCVGEEVDVQTHAKPRNVRQGVRIVDTGSIAGTAGGITDSGIGILKAGSAALGFRHGILFGDEGQAATFPISPGGTLMKSVATSTVLNAFIDLADIQAAPTFGAMLLPAGIREMCFGFSCGGGSVISATTQNGGQLVFGANAISFNWAASVFSVNAAGDANFAGALHATRINTTLATPASSTAACTAGDTEADTNYIYVCVAKNTWRRTALTAF